MQAEELTHETQSRDPAHPDCGAAAFQILRDHYGEIGALLDRLAVTPIAHAAIRERLLSRLAEKLLLQVDLEETLFYPAIEAFATLEIDRGRAELAAVKALLAELLWLSAADPQFPAKLEALGDLLHQHASSDERRHFPLCETALGPGKLANLGQVLRYYLKGDCAMLPYDEAVAAETHLFI